jgi:hypothetical protein
VAERSLWLGICRILWGFDITPKLDEQGQPILPDPEELTEGIVVQPATFPVNIKPRSQHLAEVITREWIDAEEKNLDPTTKQWLTVPLGLSKAVKKSV